MECVYHVVPEGMVGTVLFPLDALADVSPVAFELQRAKYRGREAVLDARITADGLRFTATVHCAPLHPHQLFRLRARMNLLPRPADVGSLAGSTSRRFFEIPVERIGAQLVYWYRWETPWVNGYPGEEVASAPPLDEFEPFDAGAYRRLSAVPPAHVAYLEQAKRRGIRPLTFVHVPHVLVAGPIETDGLRIVDWQDDAPGG